MLITSAVMMTFIRKVSKNCAVVTTSEDGRQ